MEQEALFSVLGEVEKKHKEAIQSNKGMIRNLELLWQELNSDHFDVTVPTWTDRERGFMKDIISRYTDDDIAITMQWSVRNWLKLAEKFGGKFPNLPVFSDFYFYRDRIWAEFRTDQQREEHLKIALRERDEEAKKFDDWKKESQAPAGKTLMEMFLEARAEVRRMKEAGIPLPKS